MCSNPHTDSKHVNESNVALAVLKNPVEFRNMIDPSKKVEVMVVFLLAINDPDSQVTLLSKLMSVFQNVELLKQIKSSSSTEEVTKLLECIGI